MNTRTSKKDGLTLLMAVLLVVILVIMAAGICLLQEEEQLIVGEVTISADSGFYAEDISIKVENAHHAQVYYTENGAEPTPDNAMKYQGPIVVKAQETEQVKVYRFLIDYTDERESEELVRTYFVGKNIKDRYNMMVLNIAGDPEGFYSYDNGIFVPGKVWDEFWEANPDAHVGGYIEANYTMRGDAWERPVYAQFFDENGTEILAQNCGVRVHGDQTRIKNQKSFRLYARKEYDVENEFDFAFFGDLASEETGVLGAEYKRLVVRSSGNDNGFGYVRTEMVGRLAADAGFPDTLSARPICVYINGEYKGVYWLESYYEEQYFENKYGVYDGEFMILEGGDQVKNEKEDPHVQSYVEEYNGTYQKFAEMDLTKDENYEALCKFLDVENYIKYFAIEHYIGNDDWPKCNLKAYRYIAPDGNYTEGTVFDGRYRHLLFDTDFGFGLLTFNEAYGIYAQKPTMYRIMSEDTPLFVKLMEREDCREYFVNYTCDLINGPMRADRVAQLVDRMHASRYEELRHMLEETDIMKGSLWESEEELHIENADQSILTIKEFAIYRPETVYQDMQDTLGLNGTYRLKIDKQNAFSAVKCNTIYVDEPYFEGTYFTDYTVLLEPVMADNEIFSHWEVNGETVTEPLLQLEGSMVAEGEILVRMITEEKEEPLLEIQAVKAKGSDDFVEVVNRSNQVLSTRGYFLSDNEDLEKYAFPVISLKPGESVRIYGKTCMSEEALGQLSMNFNLKEEEVLTLSKETEVVESLIIPKLSSKEGVYTKDFHTGKYREEFE